MKYNLCYFNPLCCPIEQLLMYTKVRELMLFKQCSTYVNVIYRLCKLVTYQRHEDSQNGKVKNTDRRVRNFSETQKHSR